MQQTETPQRLADAFDVQGHRGARGLLPENTIPAFLKALDLGVTTLELDVVIAKDSTVVVSHEPWMSGTICTQPNGEPVSVTTQEDFLIFEMTYDEVARFDCGSRGNLRFPKQEKMVVSKPRLRDVIEAAEAYLREQNLPPVQYNIETKAQPAWDGQFTPDPETFTRLLYDVLVEAGVKDRTILQSFDVRTLRVGRDLDPSWRLALLVERDGDQRIAANLEALGFLPDIYSPDYRLVDAALIREAHDRGILVIPWTVNTLDAMQRLKALGVDGIITDFPDIGVQLLD
ncbi:MAG TPA: glycerophosphodiester phosphodiesterase family protein [Rhodothermales bacterium]|nr:glycerophosphodiester phosphodiesterase family protein [Rhodothermales bacterium]